METPNKDLKFSKFHGIDRDKIDWHPVIDELKCIGCGMCATSCGRGVYRFDYKNKKSKVSKPNNCMVACITGRKYRRKYNIRTTKKARR